MADPTVSQSCSAHPSCGPGCPAARSSHGDPKTPSPLHVAHRKHTSVMPPSPHRCRTVHGDKPLESKVLAWMIMGDSSMTSCSCRETFWVGRRLPPKHQRTPSRQAVLSVEDPLNAMPGHLWAALISSKGYPSSASAFVEPLWASDAEPGPP